jgi:hypothetical protein
VEPAASRVVAVVVEAGGTVVVGAVPAVVVGAAVVEGMIGVVASVVRGGAVVVVVVVLAVVVVLVGGAVVVVVVGLVGGADVVVVVVVVVVVGGEGTEYRGGDVVPPAKAHPSTSPAIEAEAPATLKRHSPPRSAVQYDQNAEPGGMSTQSSVSVPGRPSIRHTKAGFCSTTATSKPASASAWKPVLAVGAQPTVTPPPRSAKSTTTVVPSPGGHSAAADGMAGNPKRSTAAREANRRCISRPAPG